jgi:hypothetical protein
MCICFLGCRVCINASIPDDARTLALSLFALRFSFLVVLGVPMMELFYMFQPSSRTLLLMALYVNSVIPLRSIIMFSTPIINRYP